jgi:hypothetical protein
VANALEITSAVPQSRLLDLPWETPLEEWPDDVVAALPRGISRHVVRFVRLGGTVYAVKETNEPIARREYQMLRTLNRLDIPGVEPAAVVSGRATPDGDELQAALVTRHLPFSLPYRLLFSQALRPDTAARLIDALTVLLVRLHLVGFYWGDVSLSNTLFRNIAGELMDLQAAGYLDEDFDPIATSDLIVQRYTTLWAELTDEEAFERGDRWRVDARIRRLNDLGFDVGELGITTDVGGTTVRIQPKVVDAGHHTRRLLRLTGLDAEENQARRLLNDMDAYIASQDLQGEDEEILAHQWLTDVFEPVVRAVPPPMRRKLPAPEVFHEVLVHRWYLSESAGHDVGPMEAVQSYIREVLAHRPDEAAVVESEDTQVMPVVIP